MEPLDLLIVGAGPVGLAVAAGAIQRGVKRILVVDQARSLRPVGQFINLLPNAVQALHLLCPSLQERLEPFRDKRAPGRVAKVVTTGSGKFVGKVDTQGTFSMVWWQLQKLLLEHLPPDILVLDHQLVDVKHEGGVAVAEFLPGRRRDNKFKNWEGDDFPEGDDEEVSTSDRFKDYRVELDGSQLVGCRAKVIVGADGINSAARRCVYRDEGIAAEFAEAMYTGFVRILTTGNPKISEEDERVLQETYMRNGDLGLVTCEENAITHESLRWILFRRPKHMKAPFSWLIMHFVAINQELAKSSQANELFNMATEESKRSGFAPPLLRLEQELWNDAESHKIVRPMYIVPAKHPMPFEALTTGDNIDFPPGFRRPWFYKRLVLVGDAKHGAPPFLAEGSAMGMEDAYVLVSKLEKTGIWEGSKEPNEGELTKVFEEYVAERMERVCMFQNYTMNRLSEYDEQSLIKMRKTMWSFEPERAAYSVNRTKEEGPQVAKH